MLTKKDLEILQRPFAANEHEFLKGKAYITEGAITDRIEMVDPAWELEQISLFNRPESNQVICTMRLTINGVHRDGVGMSQVTKLKSGEGEANEAEKAAATDALKRAARLFGIGRYLLDLPGYVVDVKTMGEYLGGYSVNPFNGQKTASAQTTHENQVNAANTPLNAKSEQIPMWLASPVGDCWAVLKTYLVSTGIYINEHEMKNSFIKRGIVVGTSISDDWKKRPANELIAFLKTRHEQPLQEAS